MPKKYHRPPSTKRRKAKKSATTPRVLEPLPEDNTDHSTAVVQDPPLDQEDEVYDDAKELAAPEPVAAFERPAHVSHLTADYRYVVTEIRLSVALAAFLIVAIVITAILR